ncbi:hypothetical protein RHMOL_Rhmol10G0080000 [Rhododendron molle]|uniref:Uncharacterized protein n=1 Tax=Rhododendron molle TaxID=49168 RepID=A0ACC0M060_RHOML|nr:hypothetical protein RHMOL_Rhmol10G0080000 [Rhododendron molle]
MAKSKRQAYISVPAQIISSLSSSSLQSLLLSPKKSAKKKKPLWKRPMFWFLCFFLCFFLVILKIGFNLDPLVPFSPYPCSFLHQESSFTNGFVSNIENNSGFLKKVRENQEQSEFWKQPDGLGYRLCLGFSREYNKWSGEHAKDRTRYLMVVVTGGMNQQRNQIVDAVVIARILGAALAVPNLQVNVTWGDERPLEDKRMPVNVTPQWIRTNYARLFRRGGVALLRGLESKLSKDLPSDLQKLRCKVAFHALKFAAPILVLGNKITERMRSKGPYLALHLRMEKDVWVRTGCLPGWTHEYDEMISSERKLRPWLLTSKSNMTYQERKLAGLWPLNALEVTRLLKALGAPKNARIYWAGGNPLGGKEALLPLIGEFPNLYNKEDLALPGELEPFANKALFIAAIDYIVAENSDVFMPSHGGNMGHALQGHRAYAGHKKYITPNKRHMLPYFLNDSLPEAEFNQIIMGLHRDSLGQP